MSAGSIQCGRGKSRFGVAGSGIDEGARNMGLIAEVVVPACSGRVIDVKVGQQLRVVAPEGPQAADVVAFNPNDPRESLCVWLTRHMSGSFATASRFYTKLPAGRVMFELASAPEGCFWLSPGRCNRLKYESQGRADHPNCQDILSGVLDPYGLGGFYVPDVLNIFMNPSMHTDGTYEFLPSPVEAGAYVALQALMDATVAVSACPDDAEYNNGQPKPIVMQTWDSPMHR
jgi:uncharacterized protein